MTAPAASVAAVQKALDARGIELTWADCQAAADAAVQAATPGIQAGALRGAADEWQSRLKSTHPLDVEVADRIVGWLTLRADRIEADHE